LRTDSGRAVARVESADFVRWNFTEPLTAPVVMTAELEDEPGTEIYSVSVFPYESATIGLVQVFHARPDACTLDVQLAVSRDGMHFTRVADRSPILPVGPIGSWDRFNQSLANNPPIAVGDELRLYYGGRTYRHSPYQGKDVLLGAEYVRVAFLDEFRHCGSLPRGPPEREVRPRRHEDRLLFPPACRGGGRPKHLAPHEFVGF